MTERRFSRIVTIALAFLAMILPASANAQQYLSDILGNASVETYYGPGFVLSVVSFVVGAAVVMWGCIKLKESVDGKAAVSDGIWRIGGGSMLMALPWAVNTVLNTIYGGYADGTEGDYSTGLATYTGNCQNGLDACMVALVQNIYEPFETLVNVACYILGGICVAVGLYRLAQAGNSGRGGAPSTNGTIAYIAGGGILISLGEFMDVIRDSIFGGATGLFSTLSFDATNPLPTGLQTDVNGVFMALFAWVQLIGWLAFARGIYLLIKISQGNSQRTHGHAFTHIICGALAVNMYALMSAIQTTLGISLVT